MKNSQVVEILKVFSQKEIKEFGDFVRSPFFNKNQSVVTFFDHLKKYHPDFPDDKIDKKKIHIKMFPGSAYNDGFMRKIMFTLSELAEKFLVYNNYKDNDFEPQKALLEQYHLRGNARLFKRAYNDFLRLEKSNNVLDQNKLYYGYIGRMRNLDFSAEHKSVEFVKFANSTDLLESFDFLSAYFLGAAFNLYEYYLNTQRMTGLVFDYEYFEKIINSFDKKIIQKFPLLNIHYHIYKMLTDPENDKHFYELKAYVFNSKNSIEAVLLENTYINLQNYCMRKIRSNNMSYAEDLLDIYEQELAEEKFSTENNMSYILYRNVVFTALLLKKIDYADKFAEDYKACLPEDARENYYLTMKANIMLKKKDFAASEKFLSKIKGTDELLKAEVKSMQLQVYFETDSHSQFYSLIDTFKHYLKNNFKLSEERKTVYNAFVNFLVKIYPLKESKDVFKLDKLKTEIGEYENVINKAWLLEKINEVKV